MLYSEFKNTYPIGTQIKFSRIQNPTTLADQVWNSMTDNGFVYKIIGHMGGFDDDVFKILATIEDYDKVNCKKPQDFLTDKHLLNIEDECLPHVSIIAGTSAVASVTVPSVNIATHYPDICPHCGAPAYIGFYKVDCSKKCQ